MRLGDVLIQRREGLDAAAFGHATPITVHLDGAISVRSRTEPYKGPMFAARPGDVVFSKIDARQGAIGVLPATIPRAVVTPEFPVFRPDAERLDSRFLDRLLRTGGFISALNAQATGTSGRKRITPEKFKALAVPLPSLEAQNAIVDAAEIAEAEAVGLAAQADVLEHEATAAFEAALGLAPPPPLPDRPVFLARFAALDRWSHEAALRAQVAPAVGPSKWPTVRLRDVVADLENGWSPQCLNRPAEEGEWGVLKVSSVSRAQYEPDQNKALPSQLSPRPHLQVRAGDVLIARASGVARLVGISAYVESTPEKLMIADKLFRVVFADPSPINGRYLSAMVALPLVRTQIEKEFSNDSGMMKNVTKPVLLSLTFPLPPLDEQERLIETLADARQAAAELRETAEALRARARADFEAAVGVGPAPAMGGEAAP